MYVYVDESGDPGLKVSQGSSKYFVFALLIIEDKEISEKISNRICLLREELGLPNYWELKFNRLTKDQRIAFLKAVNPYNFFYYGICINKAKLSGEGFKVKESFYKYACQLAFSNAKVHLEQAIVHIDKLGEKTFRKQLQTYLKKKINQDHSHLKEVHTVDSKKSDLIQMADMIAGAINRSLSQKNDALIYRKIILSREMQVQVWPTQIKKPKS